MGMSGVRAGASNLGKSAFFVLDDAERVAAGAVAAFSVHAGQGCAIGSAKQPSRCASTRRSSESRPVVAAAHTPGRLSPDRHPAGGASAPISRGRAMQAGQVVPRWLASQSCRDGAPRREGTATAGPPRGPAVRHRPPGRSQDEANAQLPRTARRRRISKHVRHGATSTRSSCGAWALGVRGGR
ncbi:hypothetical protein CEQ30_40725 [Nocardia brasiliensis]|nr:hypothetical protein CEQ30_40725 [Nocardia brasiliensis]